MSAPPTTVIVTAPPDSAPGWHRDANWHRSHEIASSVYAMPVGFLTGSVLVETVFVWPGIGRLLVEAIDFRDFTVIQGVTLLIGAAFIFGNLLIDLLYIVLNPRLRTA